MANTLLIKNNGEEIASIMSKKFTPKLKIENNSITYSHEIEFENNEMSDEVNTFNKVKFLFPSITLEVSKKNILFNNLFLKKIEYIFKNNKNISIEEGIEQLRALTLSEKSKNKSNIQEPPQYNNNIANSNNNSNFTNSKKFQKFQKRKRNHNALISNTNQLQVQENINNYNNNEYIYNNNNTNNNRNINNNLNNNINNNNANNSNNENIQERQVNNERELERLKERKKMELKTADKAAQELLESKNQNELKEYLFRQLVLLDQKKNDEQQKEKINNQINASINQLNKDKIELRKCNTAVSRALNRKTVEHFQLDNKVKNLENEVKKVRESINYHAYQGDLFHNHLKNLKGNIY